VAIIVMTVVALLLKNYAGVNTIETIGDRFTIDPNMPKPEVPKITWEVFTKLMSPALVIAMLGAIESLLSAAVADGVIGDKHDSNQELVGQGIANMVCSLFGGIPATGAIARTMTNINNGGRTPVAGIIHALVLLLIYFFLMPYAQYIPMSCLAGVLVVVSYNMSGWRTVRELMHNPKSDVTVLWITFILTVIFDLTIAIEIGLVLACLLFLRRMTETTKVSVLTDEIDPDEESDLDASSLEHLIIPEGVEVYEINGPYFFGVANKFEDVMASMQQQPKVRIIRMRKVPFIDSTGIHNLINLISMSHKDNVTIILSGVNEKVRKVLDKNKFADIIGEDCISPNINAALLKAKELVEK
jgi:SulP family sulfate permease